MITSIFWIIPLASVLALAFAWFFFRQMMKESEGTELMKKIASFVREGAMSYLKQHICYQIKRQEINGRRDKP